VQKLKIELLPDSGDWRGSSFQVLDQQGPGSIGAVRNLHLVSVLPGAARGNHYHRVRTEVLLVHARSPWRLLWKEGEFAAAEHRFEGRGAALISIPPLTPHTLLNDGTEELWVTAFLDGPYDPAAPDVVPYPLTPAQDPFLEAAIGQARKSLSEGGIPIGSVLIHEGRIIGQGHNCRVQTGSAIDHGEMNCLRNAGRLPASVYRESTMYSTLSPCPMCSGAIVLYKIPRVVIGENRNFLGAEDYLKANSVEVLVTDDSRCITLMKQFIDANLALWNEDIGL
jgi:cytosine/creatinine deaminase